MNGFVMMAIHLLLLTSLIVFGYWLLEVWSMVLASLLVLVWFIMMAGYIQLEPNEARVMIFFGTYKGTFREGYIPSWTRRSSPCVHATWMLSLSR